MTFANKMKKQEQTSKSKSIEKTGVVAATIKSNCGGLKWVFVGEIQLISSIKDYFAGCRPVIAHSEIRTQLNVPQALSPRSHGREGLDNMISATSSQGLLSKFVKAISIQCHSLWLYKSDSVKAIKAQPIALLYLLQIVNSKHITNISYLQFLNLFPSFRVTVNGFTKSFRRVGVQALACSGKIAVGGFAKSIRPWSSGGTSLFAQLEGGATIGSEFIFS